MLVYGIDQSICIALMYVIHDLVHIDIIFHRALFGKWVSYITEAVST